MEVSGKVFFINIESKVLRMHFLSHVQTHVEFDICRAIFVAPQMVAASMTTCVIKPCGY